MKIYFLVEEDASPGGDGVGPMRAVGAFTNKDDATAIALTLEPYGRPGQFTRVSQVEVFETQAEFARKRNERKRSAALAKLTKEDRRVLGLE